MFARRSCPSSADRGTVEPHCGVEVAFVEETALLVVAAAIFIWGAVSARLERVDLTAPIVFTAIGAALAGLGLVNAHAAPEQLKPLVEVTLVWVLFSDAARVRVHDLRRDVGGVLRLLAVGLPLTVLAGWGLAFWLFPALGVWLALLVGAALAPTDAALGVPVVTNTKVPSRVRRLITVESGLNDGIATPVVMVAIAGAAAAEGTSGAIGAGGALVELAIGVAIGAAVGYAGGWLLRWARSRGWAAEDFTGIAVLALALLAYLVAVAVDGNGFVAAFCGGIAFGAAAGRRGPAELAFLEQTGGAVSLLVWTAFGAIAVPIVVDRMNWTLLLYGLLSLTLVRMVPVALALIGAGFDRSTVLFVGWFGPRGLASLVFALLALEDVGSAADEAVAVIAVTVLLSVLAHGISAAPLAARYGRAAAAAGPEPGGPVPDLPVRGLPRLRVPLPEEGPTAPSAVGAPARQEVSDRDDHDSDGRPVG
jgi:sodium/hydrogen antiporter